MLAGERSVDLLIITKAMSKLGIDVVIANMQFIRMITTLNERGVFSTLSP